MKRTSATTRQMLLLVAGWIVWSSCFVALYATLYIGCEFLQPPADRLSALNALLLGICLPHMAVLIWLVWRTWPFRQFPGRNRRSSHHGQTASATPANGAFIASVTALSSVAALAGLVWLAIPIVMVPPCPVSW